MLKHEQTLNVNMPPPQNHPNLESESNHSSVSVDVETLISSPIDDEIESNHNEKSEALLLLPTVAAAECVESTHREAEGTTSTANESEKGELNGRERLKRHRVEVAGRVWIPDIWGQEDCLKDWIDCAAFDSGGLVNSSSSSSIVSAARAALVEEGRRRRRNSTRFRVVTVVD